MGRQGSEIKGRRDGLSRCWLVVMTLRAGEPHRSGQVAILTKPVDESFVLLIVSKIVSPTASQTCSSWGPSKELELAKCKEDLQDLDVEKIFNTSSRIAKVTRWEGRVGSWAGLQCLEHV